MQQRNSGILELVNKDGRLRDLDGTLLSEPDDPVVPASLIEKLHLRPGLALEVELGKHYGGNGQQQQNQRNNRNQRGRKKQPRRQKTKLNPIAPNARVVKFVKTVEGVEPQVYNDTARSYDDLTSIDPRPRMELEYPGCPPACRLIDLFCPIGYGQRALIVSPPKAGKTTLLQNIANGIRTNHPDVEVIALLIDERPEEVTDFRRSVPCKVWASSNDHGPEKHAFLAMVGIERAKRMAETGKDVVVLLDSLTRVGRAFNNVPQLVNTGRVMTGGLDSGALAIPKQLFGAARKFEEGGSLTIIASCLIDTGSRGDQIIFEEFKGTGNMELILDRKIAEHRLFPAINLAASGTRKEDLMLNEAEMATMTALRRRLLNMQPTVQVEQLLKALERFKTNADLVGQTQTSASA